MFITQRGCIMSQIFNSFFGIINYLKKNSNDMDMFFHVIKNAFLSNYFYKILKINNRNIYLYVPLKKIFICSLQV